MLFHGGHVKVAVLGAGLTGSLVALELASSGHYVTLFDRRSLPFSGASLASEGKIHLGYVYALDRSQRTAATMFRGAASFQPLIEKWTGRNLFDTHISEPFLYAVPKDSLMSVDEIRRHFYDVSNGVTAMKTPPRLSLVDAAWEEMSREEVASIFDPLEVVTAFRTRERAIDTAALAVALRAALAASFRLELCMETQITSVTKTSKGLCASGVIESEPFSETFDVVVNALWEHRVHIDATFGLPVERPVIHRFKYGLFTRDPGVLQTTPNVTFLIGPYGDTVTFSDNAYVSWYPVGLISQERAIRPAQQDVTLSEANRLGIIQGTIRNLRRLMPGGGGALSEDPALWTLKGGFVTAWGQTGIEDVQSELHKRYEVGVFSSENYHSIDTGKLTTAPMFAAEVCARINARMAAA